MSDQDKISALAGQIKDSMNMSASPDGTIKVNAPTQSLHEPPKSDVSLVVPVGSHHFDSQGKHVPGFNETNLGLGIKTRLSENSSAFVTAYNNSYKDSTLAAGINYTPLKAQKGDFKAEAGVTAGVAYTEHGSYAKQAPKISVGKLTPVAGLITSIEHIPTGIGVDVNIVPPVKQSVGFVGVSITKRF